MHSHNIFSTPSLLLFLAFWFKITQLNENTIYLNAAIKGSALSIDQDEDTCRSSPGVALRARIRKFLVYPEISRTT